MSEIRKYFYTIAIERNAILTSDGIRCSNVEKKEFPVFSFTMDNSSIFLHFHRRTLRVFRQRRKFHFQIHLFQIDSIVNNIKDIERSIDYFRYIHVRRDTNEWYCFIPKYEIRKERSTYTRKSKHAKDLEGLNYFSRSKRALPKSLPAFLDR